MDDQIAVSSFHFDAPYTGDDIAIARFLLAQQSPNPAGEQRIDGLARRMISSIRDKASGIGGIDEVLREYSLSTKEGLALMVLAEALLRIPDAATADRFIEDKLGQGDFSNHKPLSNVLLVNASAWALGLTARIIQPGEKPEHLWDRLVKRIGLPAVRMATRRAMQIMGNHFVLGQTIEAALKRGRTGSGKNYRYTFDMLGEGARTAEDSHRHFEAYLKAIDTIGATAGTHGLPDRPGISVKLSALHPRFEAVSRQRVLTELVPKLLELARKAKTYDLNLTVDSEEADRLELLLDVVTAVFSDPSLAGWDGFGFVIQSYLKRALSIVDYVADLTAGLDRKMMIRLVKGAYWDAEVKRAQERGLNDYPVFTRKAMTDLNYLACARKLLALRPRVFPQFASHNALSVAMVLEEAGDTTTFEFQRLHGMGDVFYAGLLKERPDVACRVYAPVGRHRDLLAYLVRRLLENGANSSFVSAAGNPSIPIETLLVRPAAIIGDAEQARHPTLPLPLDLFGSERRNSRGIECGHAAALAQLTEEIEQNRETATAYAILDGKTVEGSLRSVLSPIDGTVVGEVHEPPLAVADTAITLAQNGFAAWHATPPDKRAAAIALAADLLEERRARFIALLQHEAGKTLDDALSEVREAVDFCRYYAAQGRSLFGDDLAMPGPTGESNILRLRGRGVFVAISPWNFPLAIFLGQITAALMAGNAVVAKPAEQTPLVAAAAIHLLHEAGIPRTALHLVTGDGTLGARLVEHTAVDGVVFTGSTDVARRINRALAAKSGAIIPLIAETGGINAMIVDATALPEQVVDDVVTSAFRSAGQRCSALRLLCLQEDIAEPMIRMIIGATRELRIGDPRDPATHIGPVIDLDAKLRLEQSIAAAKKTARLLYEGVAPSNGTYIAPHLFEVARPSDLTQEIFGPILHVVRYSSSELPSVLDAIRDSGYGLTLGIHSRIDDTVNLIIRQLGVGNIYVNRNMIGAVVGVQPFGGHGLSGTGPKAGGPHYLLRFATEQTITVNTAAAGGNAELMSRTESGER
ncbi:MAG TPA: bifunctional proline dehydrogenase/L-glutamate gamma-semialdehyde dehydrogenase PutA [Telmatospirillum sp.]|nr:bifunctional proline dehydrogenase/L-glutamate gamma-semialdehyde dehydrogenase PutA [Telmatospirillum sp.]